MTKAKLDELAAILALQKVKGFGPVKFRTLYEYRSSFSELLESNILRDPLTLKYPEKLRMTLARYHPNLEKFQETARALIEKAESMGAHLVTYFDETYPRNLYNSNSCVPVLYTLGNPEMLRPEKVCAVVGTRVPTPWAEQETRLAVSNLVKEGFTVVSGLAKGIDAIAHSTALESLGSTIAVVGSGVDVVYPRENAGLREKIVKRGAIVSEYAFGTEVRSFALKKRNKITVGLSKCVLITQTSTKGGTMNAYFAAIEQKKPVGVLLPPNKRSASFGGNLRMVAEGKLPISVFENGSKVRFGTRELPL